MLYSSTAASLFKNLVIDPATASLNAYRSLKRGRSEVNPDLSTSTSEVLQR
jgi:hypothetical protein